MIIFLLKYCLFLVSLAKPEKKQKKNCLIILKIKGMTQISENLIKSILFIKDKSALLKRPGLFNDNSCETL